MKKLIIVLSALLVVGISTQAWAEISTQSYTGKRVEEQQVFVYAYNNSGSDISTNNVVILDTAGTAGTTLGTYITTTATADSVYAFGITDGTITTGNSGLVCVRGPHIVRSTTDRSAGDIMATSTTAGSATVYATSDGTAGGYLGTVIGTASAPKREYWIWVNPQIHK